MAKVLTTIANALAAKPPLWDQALSTARNSEIFRSAYGTQKAAQLRKATVLLDFLKAAFSHNLSNPELDRLVDDKLVQYAFECLWPQLGDAHKTLSRAFCLRLTWFWFDTDTTMNIGVELQLSCDRQLFRGALCTADEEHCEPLEVLDLYELGDNPAFVWAWFLGLWSGIAYPIGSTEYFEELGGLDRKRSHRAKFETIVRRFVAAVWRVHNASPAPYDRAAAWAGLFGKFQLPAAQQIVNALVLCAEAEDDYPAPAMAFLERFVEQIRALRDNANRELQQRASQHYCARLPTYEPAQPEYHYKRLRRAWLASYFGIALRCCTISLLHALHCNSAFESSPRPLYLSSFAH